MNADRLTTSMYSLDRTLRQHVDAVEFLGGIVLLALLLVLVS